MAISLKGTHLTGPLVGDNAAGGGLFEDLPSSVWDVSIGYNRVWAEHFSHVMATGDLAQLGCTVTATGVAGNSETTGHAGITVVPGTVANTGYNIQVNAAATHTVIPRLVVPTATIGLLFSSSTQNNREVSLFYRFGLTSNTPTWDGAVLIGLFSTDTTLIDGTTGLPTVANGGMGLHIGQTGVISFVDSNTAITAAGAQIGAVGNNLTPSVSNAWFDIGIRHRQITATTGSAKFYFGRSGSMAQVAEASSTHGSTQLFPSICVFNGAANQSRLIVSSMVHFFTHQAFFGQTT